MKTTRLAILVALILTAAGGLAKSAGGRWSWRSGGAGTTVRGSVPVGTSPSFPYSYYAAEGLAREYVPFAGQSDGFAYYGRPYGHAYDRFSWSTLSGATGAPARYYYPPVR